MTKPRVLALCAGYGGLELAVEAVEGEVELVAYAEYDDAPARIMAHHHPGKPNLRDVTKIDWHALLALGITIMTAGYPCQPFSHAGKRQGEDDPRHLWPHIAKGIGILRPALCFFENVRGHLSLGLDQVLLDLDALGYDVRVYLLRAADVGAAHGRARVFIFAEDRAQRGSVELPSGAPVAVARDGRWFEPESHLFGAVPFTGKLPGCSRLVDGHLYAEPKWASRDDLTLLPTPAVNDMGAAYTPETWDAWTARMKAKHGNGNGHGPSLEIEAQRLLPTPVADNSRGLPSSGTDYASLANVACSLLMLPSAVHSAHWGDYGPAIARWEAVMGRPAPAPTEQDRERFEARKARRLASKMPAGRRGSIRFLLDGPAHRLSPRFVEWLMGLPAGHVTDVPDLTRSQELKALGNGVVWQQAAAAYRAYRADTKKEKAA